MTHDTVHQDQDSNNAAAHSTPSPKIKRSRARCKNEPFDWLNVRYNPVRGESALWAAVITQAMMDAMSNCRNAEASYHKHEAIRWLTGNSRDFITVCLLAGFDPDCLRAKIKKTLVAPRAWRATPGKGKRYLERKRYRERLKEAAVPDGAHSNVITGPWVRA